MNMGGQIWVLTGVMSGLFSILLIFFKVGLQRIDVLIHEVHELNKTVSYQRSELSRIADKNQEQDVRLNKHTERIRQLEIKQGG